MRNKELNLISINVFKKISENDVLYLIVVFAVANHVHI